MSRNRYTKVFRNIERGQISRQEKELTVIRRKLRGQDAEYMAVPLANETKERRSTRVEQKQRDKPKGKVRGLATTRSNWPNQRQGLAEQQRESEIKIAQKGAPHD